MNHSRQKAVRGKPASYRENELFQCITCQIIGISMADPVTKALQGGSVGGRSLPPSIRARLWQLVMVVLLPLLLLVVDLVFANYRADRERAGQQAQAVAHGLALSLEGELRARIG